MILQDTVFVLGAGCSWHYKMPLGSELVSDVKQLAERLAERPEGREGGTLYNLGISSAELRKFSEQLGGIGVASIDDFLAAVPEKRLQMGKILIAWALLPQEKDTTTRHIDGENKYYGDVYSSILGLIKGRKLEEIKSNRLTIITFNYDRSLEFYLYSALSNHFGVPIEEVIPLFNARDYVESGVNIIHVHGWLSPLPEDTKFEGTKIKFGEGHRYLHPNGLKAVSENIRILTESHNGEDIDFARDRIKRAGQICFLGFGFHETNLERLGLGGYGDQLLKGNRILNRLDCLPISSSCFGMGDGDRKRVENFLKFPVRWAGREQDCRSAFHEVYFPGQNIFREIRYEERDLFNRWHSMGCPSSFKDIYDIPNRPYSTRVW